MKEELAELLDNYLNESGMFSNFKEWIESKGYTLEESGISED